MTDDDTLPRGWKVGPKGHWYAQCADCGRWIKATGIARGFHFCTEEARRG